MESLVNLGDFSTGLPAYLEQFSGELPEYTLEKHGEIVKRCFGKTTLGEVLAELEKQAQSSEWAAGVLAEMRKMSPTAMMATHLMLQRGAALTLKGCLSMEYTMAKNFILHVPDMREGITAKLIEKSSTVNWQPAQVSELEESTVEALLGSKNLSPLEMDELTFLNDIDYEQYPHWKHRLPSLEQIREMLERHRSLEGREDLLECILEDYQHKLGLNELLIKTFAKHVKTRRELEKEGKVPAANLTWVE